jgi:glycosyltransferase involved in cell wall biosynthesis
MKITIITINYNNKLGLSRTIESVRKLKYTNEIDIEYVVIDGKSNDGSLLLLKANNDIITRYVSEKDNGTYDAMNKGVDIATGDWLVFMNSGDEFYNSTVLDAVYQIYLDNPDANLIYGAKQYRGELVDPFEISVVNDGLIFACHQSMYFRNFRFKYNLKYKIYSDFDFVLKYIKQGTDKIVNVEKPLSIFEEGGISNNVSWQKRYDKFSIMYSFLGIKFPYFLLKLLVKKVF